MRRRSPLLLSAVPALVLALVAAPGVAPTSTAADRAAPASVREQPAAKAAPALRVTTWVRGLSHPWDIKPLGDGRLLLTERSPARLSVINRGKRTTVRFPTNYVWDSGETGLMGLEVDPAFPRNRRFYTCSGWRLGGGRHDIRVQAWRLVDGRARLAKVLVKGLPTTSGRHGGCRLLITRSGALLVGTGDAAVGTNPRNLSSLGGKTLRLNRMTGRPAVRNPFYRSDIRNRRYVMTYGHRNVQGLAQRSDGTLWSIEQGSFRDDEVNRLVERGDYGWHPVPGYNESVPMTDQGLPGPQVAARWRSGSSTIATSGGTFVYGRPWGSLSGTLAVAALKAERLVFMRFNARGRLQSTSAPTRLRNIDRLRTAEQLGNGRLLVLTDGADGGGRILIVYPR